MTRIEWRKFRGKYEKYDTQSDTLCQRVIGGIGWPAAGKPGAVIPLAEEMAYRPYPSAPVYVLEVFESHDLEELCKQMVLFRKDYAIEEFFTNDTNLACVNYISQRNHDANFERWRTLNILAAPYVSQSGDIAYHIQALKKSLDPGKKMLALNSKRLTSALSEISTEDISSLKDSDTPLISALAYGYVQLHVNQYLYGNDRHSKTIMEYDLFDEERDHNLFDEKEDFDAFQ